jgi:N-acetylglucosamine-6-phosphate deacetylase
MKGLLFKNARVVAADGAHEHGWLSTADTRIAAYGRGDPDRAQAAGREVIDAQGATLLPGFVDTHVHGAVGYEAMDADPDGLVAMSRFYARHGVTSFLPTTWSAGAAETLAALDAIATAMRAQAQGHLQGARILGAHMEGPYLNPRWAGAHNRAAIRPADTAEARRFLDTGIVRRITIAPEIAPNLALVDECVRRGIAVSAGHTDATYEQIAAAVAHGLRHLTHVYNAMRPLHHREPGVVGAALTVPELIGELIADNVHVHPVAMRVLFQAKGGEGVMLVTDAVRPAGTTAADITIGGKTVRVVDGAVRTDDGTLVGSVLTMEVGLRNLMRATGLPVAELWPTASRNGAAAAGVAGRKGALAPGMDADVVMLDDRGGVRMTVVEGRVQHRAGDATSTVSGVTISS